LPRFDPPPELGPGDDEPGDDNGDGEAYGEQEGEGEDNSEGEGEGDGEGDGDGEESHDDQEGEGESSVSISRNAVARGRGELWLGITFHSTVCLRFLTIFFFCFITQYPSGSIWNPMLLCCFTYG